jgi:hypothetical protein
VLLIRLDDAESLGDRGSAPAVEYVRGRATLARVSPSDFVPNDDHYLRRVAGAVRRILAGENPGRVFQLDDQTGSIRR